MDTFDFNLTNPVFNSKDTIREGCGMVKIKKKKGNSMKLQNYLCCLVNLKLVSIKPERSCLTHRCSYYKSNKGSHPGNLFCQMSD